MNVTTGGSAGAKCGGTIQRIASPSVTNDSTVVVWRSTVVTAGSAAGPKRNSLLIVPSSHEPGPESSVVANDLAERQVNIEGRLSRQAQDALADPIALHLVGTAGDRQNSAVEVVRRRDGTISIIGSPRNGRCSGDFQPDAGPDGVVDVRGQL